MSNKFHLGGNVGVIHGMPYGYGGGYVTKASLEDFSIYLKEVKYKYLLATTANKYQSKAAGVLQKEGFKELVNFL